MFRSRRVVGAAIAATLALSTVGVAHADPLDPDLAAPAAAGWLAGQLVDGERIVNAEFGFDDAGLTADVVLALASAGAAADVAEQAYAWLTTQAAGYTGPATESVFAGATAKLALVAVAMGDDPTDVGGLDLIAQLASREQADGRFTDDSEFGEFSSTLTQSLAVLALSRAPDVAPSETAVAFLLAQQCDDGGFRFALDEDGCTSAVDTTGFVVQALAALGGDDADAAIVTAADWLATVQTDQGGFLSDSGENANSTGLAAAALSVADRNDATVAARGFLRSLQDGCGDDQPGSIRFDADDGGDRDRATSQAILGLTGVGLDTVAIAGADRGLPVLDCQAAPAICPLSFVDVDPTSVHAGAICSLATDDIVTGVTTDRFAPDDEVTRAEAASLLARALDLSDVEPTFTDVDGDSVHASAIGAIVDAGIAAGTSATTFDPTGLLRRDQVATLLANVAGLDAVPGAVFDDVAASNVHRERINAIAAADITTGVTPSSFQPSRSVTRAQLASLLRRTLEQVETAS